jgi:hypothetical protein
LQAKLNAIGEAMFNAYILHSFDMGSPEQFVQQEEQQQQERSGPQQQEIALSQPPVERPRPRLAVNRRYSLLVHP